VHQNTSVELSHFTDKHYCFHPGKIDESAFSHSKETPGGPLRVIEDSSPMDIDDQSNMLLNGDDHHSNLETSHSGTNLNSSLSNRYSSNRVRRSVELEASL
jgi:hypothetical protein